MKTTIREASYADCCFVARRLRAADAEEIMPMLAVETPEELATVTIAARTRWCAFGEDGAPIAIMGWEISRPFFAQVFLYATPRWPEVADHVSRFAAREMKNTMAASLIHRAECWCLLDHHDARSWLEWLGFKQFGTATDMGRLRLTYLGFCFTRTMLEHEISRMTARRKGIINGEQSELAGNRHGADDTDGRESAGGRGAAEAAANQG